MQADLLVILYDVCVCVCVLLVDLRFCLCVRLQEVGE